MKRNRQGQYVAISTVGEKAQAFVPAPLPPKPSIEWTPDLRSKFDQALLAEGGKITLLAIDQPPAEFGSPLDMFTKTLAHEQMVTQSINNLMDLAIEEKDHATRIFLQWYVTEQVEEEENDNEIIDQLRLNDGNPQGLMMIDRELGQRGVNVPIDFSLGVSAGEA